MARPPPSDPVSSDDDAPEAVSHSISKRNAKREEKTLRDFEAEENARKKTHNRERDRKLKERAVVTRLGKPSDNAVRKGKQKAPRESNVESDGSSAQEDETLEDNTLEMRMRRAMEDAAAEIGDGEDEDGDGELGNLTDEEMDGGSDDSGMDEEMAEFDAESREEEEEEVMNGSEDESSDEDRPPLRKSSTKGQYLEDSLFASAFASQNAHAVADITATKSLPKAQISRKRQRQPFSRAKDLLVGTRTIRTLPNSLGSRARSTAHTIPSQKIRKFINQSLAVRGRMASAKAKARGWERRPGELWSNFAFTHANQNLANVGVMKWTGAPSGFVRDKQ
ncbi:hypothetical protein DEU56DRAFT_764887 [Suillus clintonianus]|uniref:uncharacterized protein n=1 Tax=Suillus clintonianus TaxID=1904413 RepID=UPI001B87FABF|nr:uncharacterized protein DEU56DRAFT_764887 [Suillus clintonianus]KAG2157481.1 hypothetical protein DEU56DRAFT_764887 [Suillus clintonianus]